MKAVYITTPLYYVNDRPHIGHAYTTIAADVWARWARSRGRKVFFLTGTDEHGAKIAAAAEAKGEPPQAFVDGMVRPFQDLWRTLNISHDDFIRTTEKRHLAGVEHAFRFLRQKGDIYPGRYEGWYCTPCETFWADATAGGGNCPECGRPLEKLSEDTWFFRLSRYEKQLQQWYDSSPAPLWPFSRAPEITRFVEGGLRDVSVSRSAARVKWGVPVPDDPSQVVYVWFDALLNYIVAAGWPGDPARFAGLWPAEVHFVGKEIFRFHAVLWPAILFGLGLSAPKRVFAHGWWTVEGEKMSKSRGNVVDPGKYAAEFGPDALRYFLLRQIPFGEDGDFRHQDFLTRYNSDLANDLGNLLSRCATLARKAGDPLGRIRPDRDLPIMRIARELPERVDEAMERLAFQEALARIWEVVSEANRFLDSSRPWAMPASNGGFRRILGAASAAIAAIAGELRPFMPSTADRILSALSSPQPAAPLFPRLAAIRR